MTSQAVAMEADAPMRHWRARKLAERVAASPSLSRERLLEMAEAIDVAAEFAAFERKSIREAIHEVIDDALAVPAANAPLAELRALAGIPHRAIDVKSLRLPVLPAAAAQLLKMSDETASVADVESAVASDAVLTGRLLGAANSVTFGSRFEITSLRQAIARIGIPESRRILTAHCFARLFAPHALKDLWGHSLNAGFAAFDLSALAGVESHTAYVVGLMHDIGRLGFSRFPPELRAAEQGFTAAGFPLIYAETLAYGLDHATLGAEILQQWELPQPVVDAVAFHHRPECAPSRLALMACIAEEFASHQSGMDGEDFSPRIRWLTACEKLGVIPNQFEVVNAEYSWRAACA